MLGLILLQVPLTSSLAAVQLESLPQLTEQVQKMRLADDLSNRAQFLAARHSNSFVRPEACPMHSNRFQDLVAKIQAIQTLFKEGCVDNDQSRFDDILNGVTSLNEQISAINKPDADSDAADDALMTPVSGPATLDGANLAGIVGNITTLFTNDKCKVDKGSFLEQSADMVQNIAQMGLLVPNSNGLVIAGGGAALASVLRLVDSLFEQRFDFEVVADRQSFIKLNCAFWDVRRDIDASGFLDVPGEEHRQHQVEVDALLDSIQAKNAELEKIHQAFNLVLETKRKEAVTSQMGALKDLKASLEQGLKLIEKPLGEGNLPVQTQKLQILQGLADLYPQMNENLQNYFSLQRGSIPVLDSLLSTELQKLDHKTNAAEFMKLVQLSKEEFNESFRASLLFHFQRIHSDLNLAQKEIATHWAKTTMVGDLSVQELTKQFEQVYQATAASLKTPIEALTPVDIKLKRMVKESSFISTDDGTENIVNILDIYDQVTEQIYGEWGFKFLKYTTHEASANNDEFEKLYKSFTKDHLDQNGNVPKLDQVASLRVMFACQDALPTRRRWRYADSLAQQGYDFVATNKELFHDNIPRVFLSNRGGRFGLHGFRSNYEKIQAHHKSSVYANKIINNERYDKDEAEKYLRYRYLGNVMLDIHASRSRAGKIQELVEKYDCTRVVTQD